ncbi:MAG TPA: mannose-6-phosphate isomerase, class I [Flexivirga sp.]|uniref:mannose-6-phosphate isomerase, class I n=1 Tax=Flexivirga sp. TaxID=1962927 RepID=UPI002B5DF820|nr:mannose-6-phosphate isomerase, class I [Flexivirga sp.]HWC24014.1 mannose-6-phosphate isomerase, class I [Flexivirga sp.]
MYRIAPQIRNYPWGSHSVLARLTGRPHPTDVPEAELWIGAHPNASATVLLPGVAAGRTLDSAIRSDPVGVLGPGCVSRFGPRLPFLLKVLAVEDVLSIQCHPSTAQVRTAPPATYPDRWGKPEAILALTRFEVFAGLRPFQQIQDRLTRLRVPLLTRLIRESATAPDPVRALLRGLLRLPNAVGRQVTADVLGSLRHDGSDPATCAVRRAALRHPDNIGLVVLLMMRYRELTPGTLMYLSPGVMHTYVSGTAVEIQANSDNVVRAALTAKPTNVAELLRIVDTARQPSAPPPTRSGRTLTWPIRWQTHFALHYVGGGSTGVMLPGHGSPRVALALGAPVRLSGGGHDLQLAPGQCCFLTATEPPVTAVGPGELYVARPAVAKARTTTRSADVMTALLSTTATRS